MLNDNLGNPRIRLAVRLALTGGSLAATVGVANAQTAPAASTDVALQEVVVTGSRISVPNQTSISPVTFVSAETIATTGVSRVEDLLNSLPQVFADQGGNVSNGASGTAAVNLRGLGANRTLVLVNGLRLGPGDPGLGGQSDINMIPVELIDSIEVLTGGASSTYGADAVGGVVNFKLNDHFEGVKIVADGSIYNHENNNYDGTMDAIAARGYQQAPSSVSPGAQESLAFIAGLNSSDGNGNVTVYATYRHIAAVLQSKYSYSACTLASGYLTSDNGKYQCSGSSTAFPGRFQFGADNDTLGPGGTLVPFEYANRYNYGALNYFQRPDERYTAGSFMHYDINPHATVYLQSMFMSDTSNAQIAPGGAFFGTPPLTFNCSNPFLSASELTTWCGGSTAGNTTVLIGRRDIEGAPRDSTLDHTDWRMVLGVKGDIVPGWTYDTNYQYSIVKAISSAGGYFSTTKLENALNVTGTAAAPVCVSGPPCVPYNIFSLGQVTQAALNYLDTPGIEYGQVTQQIVNANVTGDLGQYGLQLPSASSGFKINVGSDWSDVQSYNDPDAELASGDLNGTGGPTPPVSGGIVDWEGFAEANLPLVDDMFLAKMVDLVAGYRFSSYSQGYKTNTYKIGIEWQPASDYRLRASFQRAVRAPNISELYAPQSIGLSGTTDPCAGTAPSATAAQCVLAGVPLAKYGTVLANSAAQYNGLSGGNPSLKPETALTTSYGIGWTPSYVPNLRVQADFFNIAIENVITTIGTDTILNECVTSGLFCNDIHRDPVYDSLWLNGGYTTNSLSNVGKLQTRGVDLDMSYAYDMGAMGKISTNLVGTYLDLFTFTPIAATPSTAYNCAGYYGPICGTPDFRFRSTLRTTWQTPWSGADFTAAVRYFSGVKLDQTSPNPNISAPAGSTQANGYISNTDAVIKAYYYVDLSASIHLMDKLTFRVGVNNVLDKQPPLVGLTNIPATFGNGNTFPQIYDALGRYIFGQITAQF